MNSSLHERNRFRHVEMQRKNKYQERRTGDELNEEEYSGSVVENVAARFSVSGGVYSKWKVSVGGQRTGDRQQCYGGAANALRQYTGSTRFREQGKGDSGLPQYRQ